MAQVKPFEWYQQDMPLAIPGMKADATADVIDSYAAEVALNPGDAVIRGTNDDQCKPVTQASDVASVIGIATYTHKAYSGEGAYYEEDYCLPVMTFGDVYVEVATDVEAGGTVAIGIDSVEGAVYCASGETVSGAAATDVAGVTFLKNGVAGDIVPVRIRK
jgi:hypothetical protein